MGSTDSLREFLEILGGMDEEPPRRFLAKAKTLRVSLLAA